MMLLYVVVNMLTTVCWLDNKNVIKYTALDTLDAMPQIIWAKELKQLLGCGTHRIYALMKCPAFPSTQLGSRYFVEKEALRQWLISYRGKKIIL